MKTGVGNITMGIGPLREYYLPEKAEFFVWGDDGYLIEKNRPIYDHKTSPERNCYPYEQ